MKPILPTDGLRSDGGADLTVLALNTGSSSLKFGLYRVGATGIGMLLSGEASPVGEASGEFRAHDDQHRVLTSETLPMPGQADAIRRLARLLDDLEIPTPDVIGHRIVHGGPALRRHCFIDDQVVRQLEAASVFAPLHAAPAIEVIGFAGEHFAGVPQVACFDTAFHADLPDIARVLPIPEALRSQGIQRYGFHGLSCASIVRQLGADLKPRLIIAHLGSGCSLTAVRDGRSIDTTMGMTPTGGLVMGTRCGDLDPGVLVYLMREKGLDAVMTEDLVDHRSGLLGLSGVSGDLRRLHDVAASNPDARLAIQIFCYSARKQMAAMISALEGVDQIVFTGGVGENDPVVRAAICGGLSWMGLSLDEARNGSAARLISDSRSSCSVHVLPSLEDDEIARQAGALLRDSLER